MYVLEIYFSFKMEVLRIRQTGEDIARKLDIASRAVGRGGNCQLQVL